MNILLTSVGRRSYLVHYFREALAGQGKVIGANMFAEAPGMYAADEAVVVPPANDPGYVDALLSICQKHNVKLVCSLHDLDVFILSQYREAFEQLGIRTMLPTSSWGRIALDKFECTRVMEQAGIPVPKTFLYPQEALSAVENGYIAWPLVVKARLGFGSLGLRICRSKQELLDACAHAIEQVSSSGADRFFGIPSEEGVIIQPAIQGREICMGVCNDLEGRFYTHFTCEVHSMRAGESDAATSVVRKPFEIIARQISALTQHPGIWGIDLMEDDGVYRVIDVNPRFTGDYPFHHLAGSNIPKALVSWISGNQPVPDCFEHHPGVSCYKDLVPSIVHK